MFGISRSYVREGLQVLRLDIGSRLFGYNGQNCFNLYSGEGILGEMFKTSEDLRTRLFGNAGKDCLNLYNGDGILGIFRKEIDDLRAEIEELKANIPKKKTKKTTKKK